MAVDKKLASIFAKVFKLPESEINEAMSKDNTTEWDSLNHLMLLTEIEKEYAIKFKASDILKIRSLKDTACFLEQKGF